MAAKDKKTTEMVAYLYAVEAKTPEQIAAELEISEVTVWRHLKAARAESGTQAAKPLIKDLAPILNVSEEQREQIHALVQNNRASSKKFHGLLDRLRRACPAQGHDPHPLKGVWVFESGSGAASDQDCVAWDQAAFDFGRLAAARVAELLRPANCIGIAWGRTLQSVTQGIAALNLKPRQPASAATVFPINGDFLAEVSPPDEVSKVFPNHSRLSPTFLAAQLAQGINGTAEHAHWLIPVAAVIPLVYQKKTFDGRSEADVIKHYMSEFVSYKRIFGATGKAKSAKGDSPGNKAPAPLVDEADAFLLALGSADFPRRFWCQSIMTYIGKTVEEVAALTYGDIGAVLVPREHLTKAQEKEFRAITDCYTGIKLEQIARCAARTRMTSTNAPGVIAFGVGRSRRRITIECIRRGLVNHIVIDDDLAKVLNDFDGKNLDT